MNEDGNPLLSLILKKIDEFDLHEANPTENTMGSNLFIYQQLKSILPVKLTFHDDDLNCLSPHTWLCDSILDSYIAVMAHQSTKNIGYTNTFFFKKLNLTGCKAASNWQGFKDGPITRFDKFLVPICLGAHWILSYFDFQIKKLVILDSLSGRYDHVVSCLNNFLEYIGIPRMAAIYPSCPQQHNGDDCGVFVLMFCHTLFFGEDLFSFSQKDIPKIRKTIRFELEKAKNS